MKKSGRSLSSANIVRPTVVKQLCNALECLGEAQVASKVGVDVVDELTSPKFYQFFENDGEVMPSTDYGLIEVRLALEGSECVFGIEMDALAGDTITEKFATIESMTLPHFLQLVESHGFSYKSEPGAVIVIPGGYALVFINASKDVVHGMRWQKMGSQKNMKQTRAYVERVLSEMPVYQQTEYRQLLDHLVQAVDGDIE